MQLDIWTIRQHGQKATVTIPKCWNWPNENVIPIKISARGQKGLGQMFISGQSYKHFTLVNYDSRVIPDWKIPQITTLEL